MKRFIFCVALIALLTGLSGAQVVAPASGNKPATVLQKRGAPDASEVVGSEICASCHAEVASKLTKNPHANIALMHGDKGATCESCHGPGKAHVESGGDVTKIRQLSKMSTKEIDETCLGCHEGAHPNFERSAHGEAGVSCTSCHSVHNAETEASLLKVAQPRLCYTCHTDVKPSFAQPFHHKVDEGLMKCSDCHDVHGTFQNKQLQVTDDHNAICTKCHTETAGPFIFEHPVVKTEGCSTCHSPHGSPNARLLNVSNVNLLCLQCHSGVNMTAFPNAVSETGGPVHNQSAQYVACTNCHTQIHGSNSTFNFFR